VSYRTFLVHLDLEQSNQGLLRIAGELAERCGAGIIGIVVCQPLQLAVSEGYVPIDVVQRDIAHIQEQIEAAEAEFRAALAPRIERLAWRSAVLWTPLYDYLAAEARAADLVLTKVDKSGSLFDISRHVSLGDLVLKAGRPVLAAASGAETLPLDHVLVGWKETPEARRAVRDALPLLKLAKRVTILEIVGTAELPEARPRVADVAAWLAHHGVIANPRTLCATGGTAEALSAFTRDNGVDLVVAGAYGHSRLLELVLGGVTRDLLLTGNCSALVCH
jgi:nucleotide-binding universal stress UspA family protein